MAGIDSDKLIPYMNAYKSYLDSQDREENARPLSNVQEDYKRGIAEKAAALLNPDDWKEFEIGAGIIGDRAIKAVKKNLNLVGKFQVSAFSDKVKEDFFVSERVLFDLYHEHKEEECFEQACGLFGRKYDLTAYLYFILDPSRYLPLRPSIFDGIFKKLGVDLRTAGYCAWDNYQDFLSTVAAVRDALKDYYQIEDIDLLDAHSFLWTINLKEFGEYLETPEVEETPVKEKMVKVGALVYHKDYGDGIITKITDENVYAVFGKKLRIFPYPAAFQKEDLKLLG